MYRHCVSSWWAATHLIGGVRWCVQQVKQRQAFQVSQKSNVEIQLGRTTCHVGRTSSCCRLKACIYKLQPVMTLGVRKSHLLQGNNSGKPRPIRTQFGRHAQIKGGQRSGNVGSDWRSGEKLDLVRVPSSFFHFFVNFLTLAFHQIWPWHVDPCLLEMFRKCSV